MITCVWFLKLLKRESIILTMNIWFSGSCIWRLWPRSTRNCLSVWQKYWDGFSGESIYHFESLVFSWLSLRPTPEGETRHCHVRVEWSCSLSGVVGSRWYSGFYSQWRRDGKTNSYRSSAGTCNCACLVCVRTGNNTTYLLKTLKKVQGKRWNRDRCRYKVKDFIFISGYYWTRSFGQDGK